MRLWRQAQIKLGAWCSPVNTSPCHGEDRGFESLRTRHKKHLFSRRGVFVDHGGIQSFPFHLLYFRHMRSRFFVGSAFFAACVLAPTLAFAAPDASPPQLGAISPTTATVARELELAAPVSDAGGNLSHCIVFVNNVYKGTMSIGTNRVYGPYIFYKPDTFTVRIKCFDTTGNEAEVSGAINVAPAVAADTSLPTVGKIEPVSTKPGIATTFRVAYADNVGVTACELYINGTSKGLFVLKGSYADYTYTFPNPGTYAMYAACRDAAGNRVDGEEVRVLVTPEGANPVSATRSSLYVTPGQILSDSKDGAEVVVFVRDENGQPVRGVFVAVETSRPGVDQISPIQSVTGEDGVAKYRIRSAVPGTSTVRAYANGVILQATAVLDMNFKGERSVPQAGSLIKLTCPGGEGVNHPCRTVYYLSTDNKRRAFPHEKVFFTWYGNFSGVVEVSEGFMAAIPLEKNIVYRPGIKLVKFSTVPKVYAVGRAGQLRWVKTEEAARQLYGDKWAQNVHDIADAFYGDYSFGSDIASGTDFNPAYEANIAVTVEGNL